MRIELETLIELAIKASKKNQMIIHFEIKVQPMANNKKRSSTNTELHPVSGQYK